MRPLRPGVNRARGAGPATGAACGQSPEQCVGVSAGTIAKVYPAPMSRAAPGACVGRTHWSEIPSTRAEPGPPRDMSTAVRPLDPAKAVGVSKQLLERLERRIGRIPAVVLLVANSSAALRGYLSLFGALRSGGLAARLCEQIALRVSELNGSEYGVAEHAEFARELGLSEREIRDARLGRSPTPKLQAGLAFAEAVVASRGHVSDADLARVRAAGYTDG